MQFVDDLTELYKMSKKKEKERFNFSILVEIYKTFGRHYRKYWKMLLVAYASLFATIGITLLTPWPLKIILDYVILKEEVPKNLAILKPLALYNPKLLLLFLALALIVITVLEACFSYVNKFWVSMVGDRMNADIRERIFAHLQRLSLSFHTSVRSGDLVYVVSSDATKMKDILIDCPQDFTHRFGSIAVTAGLMAVLEWRLALMALSVLPPLYLMSRYFGAGMRKAMRKTRDQQAEVASVIVENVTQVALIQAYGREQSELARFRRENQKGLRARLQALRMQRAYSRISDFLVVLSTAAVLYFGGYYALGGAMLPGTLLVFVAYVRDINGAIMKSSNLIPSLADALASGERLLELVGNDMVMQDAPQAFPAPPLAGRIEFDNVSFAYKTGHTVLKHLSFVVEAGETVALVGHSGAGKSTLISLLLRFYDPSHGRILIDGHDVRQLTLTSLRNQMTVLLQDAMLFRQSVRDNIAFGKMGATDEDIIAAATLAEAHGFIMEMPQGYDTVMYEGGENLSGGQKQRINIARAIIRDTPIVILDEPVTGLDAKTEAQVNAALQHLTQDKTTFIIAHKFSTIVGADKILLLEDGHAVHYGTHAQLLRDSAQYRELYTLQMPRYRDTASESSYTAYVLDSGSRPE